MMSIEIWITTIGIVVQTIISILSIIATLYIGKRQIQIKLAQAAPNADAIKKKIIRLTYVILISSSVGFLSTGFSVIWSFLYLPYSPRVNMALALFGGGILVINLYWFHNAFFETAAIWKYRDGNLKASITSHCTEAA